MKPTKEEVNFASSLLNKLFDNDFIEAIEGDLRAWEETHPQFEDIYFEHGQTKICVICKEMDWVIKIDACGDGEDGVGNYCRKEFENYQEAVRENLSKFFAATYRYYLSNNKYFYLQRKVEPDSCSISSDFNRYSENFVDRGEFEDEIDYLDAVDNYVCNLDDEDRIYAVFGEDSEIDRLITFIINHNINDLHEGNYGQADDGSWVIFDYSGY